MDIETQHLGLQLELNDIDIDTTLKNAKELLEQEKDLSPAIKATMDILILVVYLFANRIGLNSYSSNTNHPKISS